MWKEIHTGKYFRQLWKNSYSARFESPPTRLIRISRCSSFYFDLHSSNLLSLSICYVIFYAMVQKERLYWCWVVTPFLPSLSSPFHTVCGSFPVLLSVVDILSGKLCFPLSHPSLLAPSSAPSSWNIANTLVTQNLPDFDLVISSNNASSWSLRCMVTFPLKRKVKTVTLIVIQLNAVVDNSSGCSLPSGQNQPSVNQV